MFDNKILIAVIVVLILGGGFLIYNGFKTVPLEVYNLYHSGEAYINADFSETVQTTSVDAKGMTHVSHSTNYWSKRVSNIWSFRYINELESSTPESALTCRNRNCKIDVSQLKVTISHSSYDFDGYSRYVKYDYSLISNGNTYNLNERQYNKLVQLDGKYVEAAVWYSSVRYLMKDGEKL